VAMLRGEDRFASASHKLFVGGGVSRSSRAAIRSRRPAARGQQDPAEQNVSWGLGYTSQVTPSARRLDLQSHGMLAWRLLRKVHGQPLLVLLPVHLAP